MSQVQILSARHCELDTVSSKDVSPGPAEAGPRLLRAGLLRWLPGSSDLARSAYRRAALSMDRGLCFVAESLLCQSAPHDPGAVSYTHLRAHETDSYLVCRLLLEKKKKNHSNQTQNTS